jgi:phosphate uptake regulator
MKRKVSQIGSVTLMVSLPSKWARAHGLKKGDEVSLIETENGICITAGNELTSSLKETTIPLTSENEISVRSILGALYRKGYDVINVQFDKEIIYRSIKDAVNNLIGFEIVDRKPGSCTIKSYVQETPDEFINTKNKMINTIKTMQDIVREDYIKGDFSRMEEVQDYRFSCWKMRDLSMRIITKKNMFKENTSAHILIIWTLQIINRNYKRMYKILKENSISMNKDTLGFYDEVTAFFDYFAKTTRKDISRLEHLHKEHDALVSKAFTLLLKGRKDSLMITYLLENIRRIQDMISSLTMVLE